MRDARAKRCAVSLPPDLHARAVAYCRAQGIPMAAWLEAWITMALQEPSAVLDPPPPPPRVSEAELQRFQAHVACQAKAN